MSASRILVAEDDPTIQQLVACLLEGEGHEVMAVSSGTAAIGAVEGFRPDLVILDVMMPGRDGFSVLEEIRSDASSGYVPVIMLTAREDSDSTWGGWRRGCDYYMTKPFDPDHLCTTVERLLESAGAPS